MSTNRSPSTSISMCSGCNFARRLINTTTLTYAVACREVDATLTFGGSLNDFEKVKIRDCVVLCNICPKSSVPLKNTAGIHSDSEGVEQFARSLENYLDT